jgi:ADP-heptose:LPS heptosyltransferase
VKSTPSLKRKTTNHKVAAYRRPLSAAFEKAGYPIEVDSPSYFTIKETTQTQLADWLTANNLTKNEKWIGIAPFAKHLTKIWPVENYGLLMEQLIKKTNVKFFLFGGGENETKFFETLRTRFPAHCVVAAGQLKVKQEVALMMELDLMLCVDSSNMHLAALLGILCCQSGRDYPDVGFDHIGRPKKVYFRLVDERPADLARYMEKKNVIAVISPV